MGYIDSLAARTDSYQVQRKGKTVQVSAVDSGSLESLLRFQPIEEVLKRPESEGYEI